MIQNHQNYNFASNQNLLSINYIHSDKTKTVLLWDLQQDEKL